MAEPKEEPDIPDHMEKLISATERAESDENNGAHSFEERVSELYEQGLTPRKSPNGCRAERQKSSCF